jgi:hypothetical protein
MSQDDTIDTDIVDDDEDGDEDEGPWSQLGEEWYMAPSLEVPTVPLTDDIREANMYPATITTVAAEGVSQYIVFDPSMKQHMVAMRASEPQFTDAAQGARWYAARRAATAAVLRAVADSGFADRLVLRGSILLKTWFGDAAREPGDLDFIVEADWDPYGPAVEQLFESVTAGAEAASRDGLARIDAAGARTGGIWTYDRVPGRRLVLPWSADDCPDGSIQIDFVLGEQLPEPPRPTEISLGEGSPATLRAASPGVSLAWKLLWLVTDRYPQGKDLYDALLLAESTPLSYPTMQEVFRIADACQASAVTLKSVREATIRVDWDAFQRDYPQWNHLKPADLRQRLLTAIEPAFTANVHVTEYQQRVRWMTALIERCRRISREEGSDAVHAELVRAGAMFPDAIIVTRELDDTGNRSVEDAAQQALAAPAWQGWANGTLLRDTRVYTASVATIAAAEHDTGD